MAYPNCYPYNESDENIDYCINKRSEIDAEIDLIKKLPMTDVTKKELRKLNARRALYN